MAGDETGIGRADAIAHDDRRCREHDRGRAGIVGAKHDDPRAGGKLRERAADVVEIRIDVEVIGLDVRDRRDGGRKCEEGAVVLVGLDDEQFIPTAAEIPSPCGDASADDAGGIASGGRERLRRHDGGGGLPVSAGDADGRPVLDRARERLRAANHRDSELARAGKLGVVARHRRSGHDGLRARHVRGIVTRKNDDTELIERVISRGTGVASSDGNPSSS